VEMSQTKQLITTFPQLSSKKHLRDVQFIQAPS
jgi:hypothetical protein